MIDVAEATHARVCELAGALFAKVGQLAELEALEDMPRVFPVAYVVPGGETAEPSAQLKQQAQVHVPVVQVIYVTRHAGDATGARAVSSLKALRDGVHGAIVGWTPPDCQGQRLQFVSGALVNAAAGVTVWADSFSVRRIVQRAPATDTP